MTRPFGDDQTAQAFASSWNTVRHGSVYTREQFLDWFEPIAPADLQGATVLEMGFGNGSLLYHVAQCRPARLAGIELGDTLEQTRRNLAALELPTLELYSGDLTTATLGEFDVVYCIGVLHHLQDSLAGFQAVLRHVRPGGRFHCWVYAHEGNSVVRTLVDPIRRFACKLPWWVTKYFLAGPLAIPFYLYAQALGLLAPFLPAPVRRLFPLYSYALWIAPRPFWFFHHVAFDQLVTPRTVYLHRSEIESWLASPDIEPGSSYLVFRNGNSWKFGGRKAC